MMVEFTFSALLSPELWPTHAGAFLIAALSLSSLFERKTRWWIAAACVATVVSIITAIVQFRLSSDPRNNVLARDVVAAVTLSALSPLLIAGVARLWSRRTRPVWSRALIAVAASLVVVSCIPWALLAVHCSSGDCL